MKLVITISLLLAGLAAPLYAGTIRLQAKAVVADATVRLGDIAAISDVDGAEKLAELVLGSVAENGTRIKAEQVLLAVATQQGSAALGKINVTGSSECLVVRQSSAAKKSAAASNAAATLEPAPAATPSATLTKPAANGPKTLSELLIERLCQEQQVGREDLRIEFETISPWLDTPTAGNQRWQFRSLIRNGSGSLQWEAHLLEGTKPVTKLNVIAKVLRRQTVLVATAAVARGEVLAAANVREEEAWLDRKLPTLAVKAADVVGLEATRGLTAGTMLDTRDFKAAEMAARGDTITVYAVSGSLVMKASARTLEPGRLHDSIKVRNDATGQTYPVTLIGKRVAAVGPALDAATEKKLREMP